MPLTPGSKDRLNVLTGIAKVMQITSTDLTTYGERVLDAGILLVDENSKIYLTDGVTALNALQPRVDQLLISVEKTALTKTFSGTSDAYKATEGGFLVLGAEGRMDKASLPAGMLQGDGTINLDWLPATVRASITYVANYAALASVTAEQKKGLVFVVDATDDPSGQVGAGAAMYAWQDDEWIKIAEVESLDLDIDALTPSYENLQASGAVMYDHTVVLTPPTLTQYITLLDATPDEEEGGGVGG